MLYSVLAHVLQEYKLNKSLNKIIQESNTQTQAIICYHLEEIKLMIEKFNISKVFA